MSATDPKQPFRISSVEPENMKLALRSLSLLALVVIAASCSESGPEIEIWAKSAPNGELQFELTNNSGRELEVYASSLPWSDDVPHPLVFSAHEISVEGWDHVRVGGAAILAHEGTEIVPFESGASIAGQVDPMHRLDGREIKDENDLYLFWTYRLRVCELDQVFVHTGVAQESDDQWIVTAQATTVYDRICPYSKDKTSD